MKGAGKEGGWRHLGVAAARRVLLGSQRVRAVENPHHGL